MWIIAALGIIGYIFNTIAYKMLDPTLCSFVRSLEIVFAEFCQVFAFHDFPSPSSIVGSSLVIFSVTAKGGEEQVLEKLGKICPKFNKSDKELKTKMEMETVETETKINQSNFSI